MTYKSQPITVFDCGGRGGLHASWEHFPAPLNYYSFEPEPDEFESLQKSAKSDSETGNRYTVLNVALSETSGQRPFNVSKNRAGSSFYVNNPDGCYRFKDTYVERTVTVECRSLTDLVSELEVAPDFITVDVEGTGLELLRGGTTPLRNSCLGVRLEVELAEIYKGAPLFDDSFRFMREAGYFLSRIETCNAGFYGVTTDMNRYSVSPMDAMPLTADFIFINNRLVAERLLDAPNIDLTRRLATLVVYCIHNGCGYLGMDIVEMTKATNHWNNFLDAENLPESRKMLETVATYLAIPRFNINKGFDGKSVFQELFGLNIDDYAATHDPAARDKVNLIYNDKELFQRFIEPTQHYAFVNFN